MHAAIALFGAAACCSAQAQINKCIDGQGNVMYTDVNEGSCRNAVIVDIAGTAPMVAASPALVASGETAAGRVASLMMTGVDMPVARQPGWGRLPVPRQRGSTDAATVNAAHQAFAATDRARAAMRTQKVASGR